MRKTTGPAARKVSEWQDLTCWVVGLNQRADFYEVVGSSIGILSKIIERIFKIQIYILIIWRII